MCKDSGCGCCEHFRELLAQHCRNYCEGFKPYRQHAPECLWQGEFDSEWPEDLVPVVPPVGAPVEAADKILAVHNVSERTARIIVAARTGSTGGTRGSTCPFGRSAEPCWGSVGIVDSVEHGECDWEDVVACEGHVDACSTGTYRTPERVEPAADGFAGRRLGDENLPPP